MKAHPERTAAEERPKSFTDFIDGDETETAEYDQTSDDCRNKNLMLKLDQTVFKQTKSRITKCGDRVENREINRFAGIRN